MMLRRISILMLLLGATSYLPAEQIFILLEGNCHTRVRYEKAVVGQPRTDYYAYHFDTPGGTRVMLETGMEENTLQNFIPQGTIVCNDSRLNGSLVGRLSHPGTQMYVLRPALNGQYYLNSVISASAMRKEGNLLTYTSKLASLQFDQEYGVIGENISYRNPSAKTIFEGRADGPCSGFYLFQQTDSDPAAPYPMMNLRISPKLGLMERRMGSDGVRTTGGVIQARSVNGEPVLGYLATNCQQLRNEDAPAPTNTPPLVLNQPGAVNPGAYNSASSPALYGGASSAPASVAPATPRSDASAVTTRTQQPVSTETHTVRKGETLYGISRQYDTTVDNIRLQNGLSGSTIYPGQELIIRTNGSYDSTTTTIAAAPSDNELGAPAPKPYQSTSTSQLAVTSSSSTNRTRLVQAGETVASVALQSGYTEARFRQINNLGPDDYLRIGQTVVTDHCTCPLPANTVISPTAAAAPATTSVAPATYNTTTNRPITLPANQATVAPASGSSTAGGNIPYYHAPADQPATAPAIAPQPSTYGGTPSATMNQLEGRGAKATPTISNSPASAAARAYGSRPRIQDPFHGTALNVPGSEPTSTAPATAPTAHRNVHIVQEGESLYIIARRYGTTTDKIRQINNLQPSEVPAPYQKLYIN